MSQTDGLIRAVTVALEEHRGTLDVARMRELNIAVKLQRGLKMWASDRVFIAPEFRMGAEPNLRFSLSLGFARRR